MRIRLAFGHYGDPETPSLIAAIDEYTEDEHGGIPDFYTNDLVGHRADNGPDSVRECFIDVADDEVLALFKVPTVRSTGDALVAPE